MPAATSCTSTLPRTDRSRCSVPAARSRIRLHCGLCGCKEIPMSDKPRQRVSAELLAATPEQIDQQRRVITATRSTVGQLLAAFDGLAAQQETYNRLGLGDDLI